VSRRGISTVLCDWQLLACWLPQVGMEHCTLRGNEWISGNSDTDC
jgi:hypothetical protein